MNKVDNAILDAELCAGLDKTYVFENSKEEVDSCLSALYIMQNRLDKLISVIQTGTGKLEDADAGFKNEITDDNLWERLSMAVGRTIYSGSHSSGGICMAKWFIQSAKY